MNNTPFNIVILDFYLNLVENYSLKFSTTSLNFAVLIVGYLNCANSQPGLFSLPLHIIALNKEHLQNI